MSHPLILPMLAQMSLTFLILMCLAPRRVLAVKAAGGVKGLIKAGGFTRSIINHGDNLKNQFETPVIFYALCLLFIVTQGEGVSSAVHIAAWIYVGARVVHALIHTTYNRIFPDRFLVFLISVVALLVMLGSAISQAL